MHTTLLGWIGSSLATIIAVIIIYWILFKMVPAIAQFGLKGAITVLLIAYGVFLLFTKPWSPGAIVPIVDQGYVDVKSQVSESHLVSDLSKALGTNPQDLGLQQPANANESQSSVPSGPLNLNTANQTAPQQATAAPTQSVVQPPAEVTFSAPLVYQVPASNSFMAIDQNNVEKTVSGPVSLCLEGWLTSNPDANGKAQWLAGCDAQKGWKILWTSWMQGIPNPPQSQVQTVLPPKVMTSQLTNAQIGACWRVFAAKYLENTTIGDWDGEALPVGTTWSLRGPGWWLATWLDKADERWFLSDPDLGIKDYPVNGYVARSFPGNDRNGTVVVYGTSTRILDACAQAQP